MPDIHKPADFNGEKPEEFPIWLCKFGTLAIAGGWDSEPQKLRTLPAYFTGQAYLIYNKLAEEDKKDYRRLIMAFQRKMGIGERPMLWKIHMRRARREPNETIDKFVCRLHDLARQAFPTDSEDSRLVHANEQYILGSDMELRFLLLKRGASEDLEVNIRMAKLYEAALDLRGRQNPIHLTKIGKEE